VGTVDTALALQAAGVEVTLFADADSRLPERAAPLQDCVVRLDPMPRAMDNPRVAAAVFLPNRLALARRFAREVARHPVDVIHAFSPGTAALLPRPAPVVVQAWFHPPRLRARLRTMLQFARRFPPYYAVHVALELQSHASDVLGYRRADVVLGNTEEAAAALRERGIEARHVPPCIGLPTDPLPPLPGSSFRVTFCAERLETPRKGLVHLLEALPLLRRPVELTLFGSPSPGFDAAIEAGRRAGSAVEVRGRVPRQVYLEHLAQRTDLLGMMSLYEEWGYTLFEAFSEGVPALAFDLYPFHDIVDRDTGVLVAPRDARAVAAAIDAARENGLPGRSTILASTAERFGSESVVRRLIPVYEQLAARVRRSS
jgi:glycosyltransferase involved in cell wall biosynthesis